MTLCDSNVWLALALSGHCHHKQAVAWFDSVDASGSVRFCRATQQAFLRLMTNAAVLRPYGNDPLTNREAWTAYQAFLDDDRVSFLAEEPDELEPLWRRFAARDTASPKLWMDAYLAALAISTGARLATTDVAFQQFKGLDLHLIDDSQAG